MTRVLFVEPPKEIWFVMGEYLPPPYGIIQLGAYVEREVKDVQVEILDCNAEKVDWAQMEKRIASANPDIVASSSLASCNTYAVAKTLQTAKKAAPKAVTVTGGQHFTATAQESLQSYPEIDVIVRDEGEQTFTELVKAYEQKNLLMEIEGISFRQGQTITHNSNRCLIQNLETLPFPGYHLVKDNIPNYHFSTMSGGDNRYVLIEGSRGCCHQCTFCTQWKHWQSKWRQKSAKRIATEMEYCSKNFGSEFIWLTDDNFGSGTRPKEIAEEIIARKMPTDVSWFVQARCDDIIKNKDSLPKLKKSGLEWILLGVENSSPSILERYKKGITAQDAKTAVKLLKENGIFAHAMLMIGQRKDTHKSIAQLREFANELDPDFVMFGILTPFPGTQIYDEAKQNGWIQDKNWSHYDMIHAIMPTETLTTTEVQEELYHCYRDFYGSWSRRFSGLFSKNPRKRKIFWHMAQKGIMGRLKSMF